MWSGSKDWGFKVGCIHGGMKPGSRDEPGTRLYAEQQFREGGDPGARGHRGGGRGHQPPVLPHPLQLRHPLESRTAWSSGWAASTATASTKDCLIFNFVATNTIEGRVLQRLLEKLQEIRDALDDDAVFNVVGEVLPAAHVERVLRDYYAGKLGDADLEDRLLRERGRGAVPGHLPERPGRPGLQEAEPRHAGRAAGPAQERRVVPETIARFIREAAEYVALDLKPVPACPTPSSPAGRRPSSGGTSSEPDWRLPALADRVPALLHGPRDGREEQPGMGHAGPSALRGRPAAHARALAAEAFGKGACFYSLQHEQPARIDFYRARVVDGLGQVIHERLFAVELAEGGEPRLREPGVLGNFTPADAAASRCRLWPRCPKPTAWLHEKALQPFLEETRKERLAEVERIAAHVELSLTELLQKADEEIGRAADGRGAEASPGAEGRLAQAENRHAELLARRDRRRQELERQRSLTLQAVERITSVLVLPHPERETPEVRRLQPNPETEATAMRVVMEYEQAQGRQVYDVHEKNLGYDITSLDLELRRTAAHRGQGHRRGHGHDPAHAQRAPRRRGPPRLLLALRRHGLRLGGAGFQPASSGRRDACPTGPHHPRPARFPWHKGQKRGLHYLSVEAATDTMHVSEDTLPYGTRT